MRLALDTNILGYAEGVNGAAMKRAALDLIEKLPQETVFVPVQVLGELFNVSCERRADCQDEHAGRFSRGRTPFH